MKSINRALLVACLVLPVVACNKDAPQQETVATPVAAPQTADRTQWNNYLNAVADRHMDGINSSPYVYLVPPAPAAAADAPAEPVAGGDADPVLSAPVDGDYERLLDKAKTDVSRGIVRGNLLIFAGLDSARTANLTVGAFEDVEAGTMRGVRLLFIGAAADADRVRAAVEPAGVEYVHVDTAQ
ncbi:hypothetical protein [Luteimonas deserti]|uniref:SPOR domain-containing protein n=1 Tax=Luteimonas deserti TaxID=2752306 RepID=A0A7Z0QPZ8_9GAMM|nr:hypothetical protein [Luteimonas deserti]NYZ62694.1 hypothetical protein [Luteimonas deserti]